MNFRSLMGLMLLVAGSLNLAHAQQPPLMPGRPSTGSLKTSFVARNSESQDTFTPVTQRRESFKRALWYASIAAALGATAFDAASSWHKQESNPLLASSNGRFGDRAVGIKIGAAAVTLIPQIILRKHKDMRTGFIIANLAETAIYSGGAIHNLKIKQ